MRPEAWGAAKVNKGWKEAGWLAGPTACYGNGISHYESCFLELNANRRGYIN